MITDAAVRPDPFTNAVNVSAYDIEQNGVLRAPFGAINFAAANSLSFGAGSLTSVAGGGAMPLGQVSNGREWVYDFGSGESLPYVFEK